MNRFIHCVIALAGAIGGGIILATAGYVLANFIAPANVIPTWLWNLTFTSMMLAGLMTMGYCLFTALDEMFLKPEDPRRITGKRYCCTRRPS
jgi:hypothetical protein